MKPVHIAMAVGLTIIWGLNFVIIRFGLDHFPPLFFATLRFVIAGLPVLFVSRPALPMGRMLAISMTLFVAQFGFLFPAMQVGYPPGLASLTLQVQGFFTVLMAAAVLRERPKPRNLLGMAIAFSGLAVIASTVGVGGVTPLGLGLILLSALGWAAGNVILRGSPSVDIFPLISWISLLAVGPLLALSLALEGSAADWRAVTGMTWSGLGALAYVAVPTTILGFYIWGQLLKRYPAGLVAPFTLMVPVTGTLSAYLILGETFSLTRILGMGLILIGLAVNTLPLERWLNRSVVSR